MQAHGPGFSKILIGDDQVDQLGEVSRRDGRKRLHQQRARLHQLLRHLGQPAHARDRRRDRAEAGAGSAAAARSSGSRAGRIHGAGQLPTRYRRRSTRICKQPGVADVTAKYRDGPRVVKKAAPTICCRRSFIASRLMRRSRKKEYMFPFVTVVECPEAKMIERSGRRWCARAITGNEALRRRLIDAVHIDRLNLGPVPTTQLNWLQPHEGNIVEFLFRPRAFQKRAACKRRMP